MAGVLAIPVLQGDEQIAVATLLLLPALLIGIYIVTRAVFGDRFSGAAHRGDVHFHISRELSCPRIQ